MSTEPNGPFRAVVAGSSGFLGSHLTEALRARGHEVVRLVRRDPRAPDEHRWDPYAGDLDQAVIDGADVVVNLAGSPNVGNPHSKTWLRELERSRVTTTRVLAEAVAASHTTGAGAPAFLNGSGHSVYGDHGDEVVTEQTPPAGDAPLVGVTKRWEAAASPAVDAGARVCLLRTSPVMHHRSPMLRYMLPVFRLGLGAHVGRGDQYFPVISLHDWVGAATHVATDSDVSGPVTMCCPTTPTSDEFTDALAATLGRRARLRIPAPLIRVAGGALAPEALGSVRAAPRALLASGYRFAHEDVAAVLRSALASPAA